MAQVSILEFFIYVFGSFFLFAFVLMYIFFGNWQRKPYEYKDHKYPWRKWNE